MEGVDGLGWSGHVQSVRTAGQETLILEKVVVDTQGMGPELCDGTTWPQQPAASGRPSIGWEPFQLLRYRLA